MREHMAVEAAHGVTGIGAVLTGVSLYIGVCYHVRLQR